MCSSEQCRLYQVWHIGLIIIIIIIIIDDNLYGVIDVGTKPWDTR